MKNQPVTPASHLLFVNACTWGKSGRERSIADLIKIFEREKLTYFVYLVPVEPGTPYEINYYMPQVEGAHALEMVEFKNGRKVKAKATKE
jgi:hypothetical protein